MCFMLQKASLLDTIALTPHRIMRKRINLILDAIHVAQSFG
jgi:hypothetical protein